MQGGFVEGGIYNYMQYGGRVKHNYDNFLLNTYARGMLYTMYIGLLMLYKYGVAYGIIYVYGVVYAKCGVAHGKGVAHMA